jgi:hypothetical protein
MILRHGSSLCRLLIYSRTVEIDGQAKRDPSTALGMTASWE